MIWRLCKKIYRSDKIFRIAKQNLFSKEDFFAKKVFQSNASMNKVITKMCCLL